MWISCISHTCRYFRHETSTTAIYTLSLHDALPIFRELADGMGKTAGSTGNGINEDGGHKGAGTADAVGENAEEKSANRGRSEEHTSELQSHHDLVCRLLPEKKKTNSEVYQLLCRYS